MCRRHLDDGRKKAQNANRKIAHRLFRIFYYDCPPLSKKVHNPISHQPLNFGESDVATWRRAFFEQLKKKRKVALRLGTLSDKSGAWKIEPRKLRSLLKREIQVDDLADTDLLYDVQQKGVDMRIGLDIASMCYKRFVDRIVLVSGDSDFVPAAKLARREGVDFVLDPMWAKIRDDLFEHIDGLHSTLPNPSHRRTRESQQSHDSKIATQVARAESNSTDVAVFGDGVDIDESDKPGPVS